MRVEPNSILVVAEIRVHSVMLDVDLVVGVRVRDVSALVIIECMKGEPDFRVVEVRLVGPNESLLTGIDPEVCNRKTGLMVKDNGETTTTAAVEVCEEETGLLRIQQRYGNARRQVCANLSQDAPVHFTRQFLGAIVNNSCIARRLSELLCRIVGESENGCFEVGRDHVRAQQAFYVVLFKIAGRSFDAHAPFADEYRPCDHAINWSTQINDTVESQLNSISF